MKILHIITGLGDGGAEGFLYRLSTEANKDTEQIVISLIDKGKYGDMLIDKGISVYTLDMNRGRVSLSKMLKLYRLIKEIKPDIVETWMYHSDLLGGVVAKLAGVKNIIWTIRHSTHSSHTSLSTRFITRCCALLSYVIPSRIVSASQRGVDVHVKLGYKQDIFVHIPNGYDTKKLSPNKELHDIGRKELGIDESTLLFGLVGRWDAQKNHYGLLEAFSIVKKSYTNFKCIFVGTNCDDENTQLVKAIEDNDLKNNIILYGRTNNISKIMNTIDINILPSIYGEAFPNVVAEAMACEVPCVVTDVGDAVFIVGNTGWVVSGFESKEIANSIFKAIDDVKNEVFHLRCLNSRKRVQELFDIKNIFQLYYKSWNELYIKN